MKRYYPVNLDIDGRNCLVVGGGSVGTRKVRGLLACGAQVTVVSPETTPELDALAETGRITLCRRAYGQEDLSLMFMVIGATDDEALNRQIHADAERRHMLCNIADRPASCNFILPAVVRRGDLLLAVSTSGKSPAFAKKLRRELAAQFGAEYETLLVLMGAIRCRLLAQAHAPEAHKPLFERLLAGDIIAWIRNGDIARINTRLAEVLGPGYEYRSLIAEAKQGS